MKKDFGKGCSHRRVQRDDRIAIDTLTTVGNEALNTSKDKNEGRSVH